MRTPITFSDSEIISALEEFVEDNRLGLWRGHFRVLQWRKCHGTTLRDLGNAILRERQESEGRYDE